MLVKIACVACPDGTVQREAEKHRETQREPWPGIVLIFCLKLAANAFDDQCSYVRSAEFLLCMLQPAERTVATACQMTLSNNCALDGGILVRELHPAECTCVEQIQ